MINHQKKLNRFFLHQSADKRKASLTRWVLKATTETTELQEKHFTVSCMTTFFYPNPNQRIHWFITTTYCRFYTSSDRRLQNRFVLSKIKQLK